MRLCFLRECFAQDANLSVAVGGISPPITHPNVIAYNALKGPYEHVIILSIDGFHQVRSLQILD